MKNKYSYKKKHFEYILEAARNGDINALEELIRRIQKDVYAVYFHLCDKKSDVSDLTQEALIKISKNIAKLKSIKSFKSWLNQIVTNLFYDYVKKNSPVNYEYNNEKLEEIRDKIGCEPGEKCLLSEIDRFIREALLLLPHNMRITIVLREFEGLSYEDISKITKTGIGTVKSRISRARSKLQDVLKEFI